METRVIYLNIHGHHETVEFFTDSTVDEMIDLFRTAAEANENNILKLYNEHGRVLKISTELSANTPETRYKMEVAAAFPWKVSGDAVPVSTFGLAISSLESRISNLEEKFASITGCTELSKLKDEMESVIDRLMTCPHLSWLGLYKGWTSELPHSSFSLQLTPRENDERCQKVFEKFKQQFKVQLTEEHKNYLKTPTFDNWQWEDHEMLILIKNMFVELGLDITFHIEMPTLYKWLCEVYKRYNNVPFHNFKHAFVVTQMLYGLISCLKLADLLPPIDIFVLMFTSICHDIDHPGLNNAYQISAHTELAVRYNDFAPLESHHCSTAFTLLEGDTNITRNLTPEQAKHFREMVIMCILATDMSRHNEVLGEFKAILPVFDINEKQHKEKLMTILIKVCDISNEARPIDVSSRWLSCLVTEFTNQHEMEKKESINWQGKDEEMTKPSIQIPFIKYLQLPLYQALAQQFPEANKILVQPVQDSLNYWTHKDKALSREDLKNMTRKFQNETSSESTSGLINSRF